MNSRICEGLYHGRKIMGSRFLILFFDSYRIGIFLIFSSLMQMEVKKSMRQSEPVFSPGLRPMRSEKQV